ncbi:GIY-YIG nuclease family protein [Reyranella sp.]|uniref:GIY-YIG nuclease family protein n=1 Tax=Reyranella sp. TaxID=1929291 RepID=UPI003C7D47DF
MRRPHGFRRFTKKQAFHSLYLVTTESGTPVKVGIASNPHARFNAHQSSNFVPLRLHRFWWVAGRQISVRIEDDFKEHFGARCVRGEWFEVALPEAEAFIEAAVRTIGTWGVEEDQVIRLMDHYARQELSMPPDAPSPLRAAPPELNGGAKRRSSRNDKKPPHLFKAR